MYRFLIIMIVFGFLVWGLVRCTNIEDIGTSTPSGNAVTNNSYNYDSSVYDAMQKYTGVSLHHKLQKPWNTGKSETLVPSSDNDVEFANNAHIPEEVDFIPVNDLIPDSGFTVRTWSVRIPWANIPNVPSTLWSSLGAGGRTGGIIYDPFLVIFEVTPANGGLNFWSAPYRSYN